MDNFFWKSILLLASSMMLIGCYQKKYAQPKHALYVTQSAATGTAPPMFHLCGDNRFPCHQSYPDPTSTQPKRNTYAK